MKNKLYFLVLILVLIISLSGCSQNNMQEDNESEKESVTKVESIDKSSEESTDKTSEQSTDKSTVELNDNLADNSGNNENTSTNVNAQKEQLMKYIKEDAINGVNIYCEKFKLSNNISDVIEVYGQPTEQNYVSSAKGLYYNFEKYNLVFGCNKGDEIFEIRSSDKELNSLNLKNIESYFGKPDYENKTTVNEKIVGYKVSKDYKILFVFDKNENLDHYSVFYPEITANYMADDPGREW